MASKKDIDISSNMDDFGDFDFDVDESGVPENKVARPSKMRSDYIPAMSSGFITGLKKELALRFPETASFVGDLDNSFDQVKSMMSNFTSEATPMVRSMGRSMNRLMPLVKPFMPGKAYNWVTGKLSAIPEEEGEMSEEERMGQQISADINAALQGADASAGAREQMSNIVGGMRHKATLGGIYQLSKQMNTVTTFFTTTMTAYMKKDLELQYRQLYAQRDIASTLRATAKLIEVELKHITHNTGLPESVKAEAVKKRGKFAATAREFASRRMSEFLKNVKEQVFDQAKESISMIADALSGGADMAEMMSDMGEDFSLKGLLLKGGFSWLGKLAGTKAGTVLAPWLKAMGGGGLEGVSKFGMDKLFEFIRGKAENGSLGMLGDIILNADPGKFRPEVKISNLAASDPNKPVAFDISTRDAIVNVIPTLLSKIHAVTMDIRDPSTQHAELTYDVASRKFISVDDTTGGSAKKMREKFNDLLKPAYDHNAVIGALAAKRSAKTGRDMDTILRTAFRAENRKELYILFQNIAAMQEGFRPDYLDQAANLPVGSIPYDAQNYFDSAVEGIKDPKRIVRILISLLGGSSEDTWDRDIYNTVDNAIRQLHHSTDSTALRNELEEIFSNGTEIQKKQAMKVLNEGLAPEDWIASEKGVNVANFRKFMANRMTEDKGNTYSLVRAAIGQRLAEEQKVNPNATEQDILEKDPQFKAWVDEQRAAESYNSTYEGSVAEELYGKDFFNMYFPESGELYTYYSSNRELLLFDTIIAADGPTQSKAHREAAKVFLGWYEMGSKAKDENEVRSISESARLKLGQNSFFMKIAQPIFSRYYTPKSIKEIYEGIKPELDNTKFFPGLAERLEVIKSNDGLRKMYGESIESVVRRNTRSKTREKGEGNMFGKAASTLAGAVARHFGPVGGIVYSIGKSIFNWAKQYGKDRYNEYKEGGIGNVKFGSMTARQYKELVEAYTHLKDEELIHKEWEDPTPEEFEKRVEAFLSANPDFVKKNSKKGEAKLKELAAKAVQKELKKERADFEKRKKRAIEARAKIQEFKDKGIDTYSAITGQFRTSENTPYVPPTDEERQKRIAAKRVELMSDEEGLTGDEQQRKAEEAVDAEIKREREDFEKNQANQKLTLADRAKSAIVSMRDSVANRVNDINGKNAEQSVIADNVVKIYALLEKKFGSLTEDEIKKAEAKLDEDVEGAKKKLTKKSGGFFKGLGSAIGGALSAINPFKSSPAAIAAKYRLDASAVESAFHGDFQRYFEYRKEMDTLIAAKLSNSSVIGSAFRGIGNAVSGIARGTGGVVRGLGTAAAGGYRALGAIVPSALKAGGTVASGLVRGAGTAIAGLAGASADIATTAIPWAWNKTKQVGAMPFKAIRKAASFIRIGRDSKDEKYYNLYRKDKLGTPGWEADPIVSVRQQKEGIYDAASDGRIEKTDNITGPVYRWKGFLDKKKEFLITKEDWDIGIVNAEGKSISDKAKEHEKNKALIDVRTGGLLGGLFKGLGSAAGGVGNLLSSIIGFDIKAIGGIGGFIKKTVGGVGRGIANFLGIGDSPKGQMKKYSVILGKMDEMIAYLKFIKDNTATLDTVSNEARDDENYASQKSSADVSIRDEEKKKKKDDTSSWWQKLLGFLKDPKGALLSSLAGIKDIALGVGSTLLSISKFTLWTLPKTLLWTIPKWLITVGFPTTWAALGKGVDWIKGNIGKTLTLAGAALSLYGAYNMYKKYKDDDGNVTHESLESIRDDTAMKNDGMALYRSGKVVTVVEDAHKHASAIKKVQAAEQQLKEAQTAAQHARRGKKAKRAREAVRTASKVLKDAQANAEAARRAQQASRQATNLPKVADSAADASSLLKKCKLDKLLSYCSGKWEQLKDVCKGFIDGIKKCKTLTAISSWFKSFFTSAKASKIGVWVKYLRFFSFLKPLVKVLMAAINYILEPAMMALDGWIRSEVMKAAAETGDSSLIDEYDEQNSFGLSRGISAVMTLGMSEVYNLSSEAVSKMAAISIDYTNAEGTSSSLSLRDTLDARKKRQALADVSMKKQADNLDNMLSKMDADVSDEETHTSAWYNVGGHIGEAWGNSSLRETRKSKRKAEHRKKIAEFFSNLEKNQYLNVKSLKNDLVDILKVAYEQQGALDNNPFGSAIVKCICRIASLWKDPKPLVDLITRGVDFVSGRAKPANADDEALKYVCSKVKVTLSEFLAHVKELTESRAREADLRPAPTPSPEPQQAETSSGNPPKDDRFSKLDAAFAAQNTNKTNDVYQNAYAIFDEIATKKWPENGVYELGNAIFVVVAVKENKKVSGLTGKLIAGTCMLRNKAYLFDRYKDLDRNFKSPSREIFKEDFRNYTPSEYANLQGCYVLVTAYPKDKIYSQCKSNMAADGSNKPPVKPKAVPPPESAKAREAANEARQFQSAGSATSEKEPAAKAGDLVSQYGANVVSTIAVVDNGVTYSALLPVKNETMADYRKRLAALQAQDKDNKENYISYFDNRVTPELIQSVKRERDPNYDPKKDTGPSKFTAPASTPKGSTPPPSTGTKPQTTAQPSEKQPKIDQTKSAPVVDSSILTLEKALKLINDWKDKPESKERTDALKRAGIDDPNDPDDIQDRIKELSLRIKAEKARAKSETGSAIPTKSNTPVQPMPVIPKENPGAPKAVPRSESSSATQAIKEEKDFSKFDAVFRGGGDKVKSVFARADLVFGSIADKKWPEDGVYECEDAIFVVATADKRKYKRSFQYNKACISRIFRLMFARYPELRGAAGYKRVNFVTCFTFKNKNVEAKEIFNNFETSPRNLAVKIFVFRKDDIYALLQRTNNAPASEPKATPPKEASDAQAVAKEEKKDEPSQKEPVQKPEEKKASTSSESDDGILTHEKALALIHEWKDKPASEERTKALKRAGVDIPDDPDDIQDTIRELNLKIDASKVKKEKSGNVVPTTPKDILPTPTSVAKEAPAVIPTERVTSGPSQRTVADMASAKSTQYPEAMMSYFKLRAGYKPLDPNDTLALLASIDSTMKLVSENLNKGNEIALQNGQSAEANAKLIAGTQAKLGPVIVNAVAANGNQQPKTFTPPPASPVRLSQGQ